MSDFGAWLRGETDEVHLYTQQEIEALDGLARVNAEAIEAEFQIGLRSFGPADFVRNRVGFVGEVDVWRNLG